MQFSVKDKRQALLRVIVVSQVALLFRTIRSDAITRVVNPAHDVIEVCFFTDTLKIGGKVTAHLVVAFTERVACKTAARFEKLFAVSGVAFLLLREFRIKTFLPQVS